MPCRALVFLGFPWSGQEGEPSCPRRGPPALQPTEMDQRGHLLVTWCRVLKGRHASPRLRPPPAGRLFTPSFRLSLGEMRLSEGIRGVRPWGP